MPIDADVDLVALTKSLQAMQSVLKQRGMDDAFSDTGLAQVLQKLSAPELEEPVESASPIDRAGMRGEWRLSYCASDVEATLWFGGAPDSHYVKRRAETIYRANDNCDRVAEIHVEYVNDLLSKPLEPGIYFVRDLEPAREFWMLWGAASAFTGGYRRGTHSTRDVMGALAYFERVSAEQRDGKRP